MRSFGRVIRFVYFLEEGGYWGLNLGPCTLPLELYPPPTMSSFLIDSLFIILSILPSMLVPDDVSNEREVNLASSIFSHLWH